MGIFDWLRRTSKTSNGSQTQSYSAPTSPKVGLPNATTAPQQSAHSVRPANSAPPRVVPSRVVVDFRSPEEQLIEQEAQRPLPKEDEELARKLVLLICQGDAEYRANRKDDLAITSAEITRIGRYLFSNGGHTHMQKLYCRVQVMGGKARLLDLYWDGIGEWQG